LAVHDLVEIRRVRDVRRLQAGLLTRMTVGTPTAEASLRRCGAACFSVDSTRHAGACGSWRALFFAGQREALRLAAAREPFGRESQAGDRLAEQLALALVP